MKVSIMMKKAALLLLAISLFLSFLPAASFGGSWNGWIYQNPYPTSNTLLAVKFVTPNKGWVAGEQGMILYTDDGGDTWEAQESGTEQRLWRIYFLNEKVGWAVGDRGVIQRTDDAGKTWVSQGGVTASSLHSVFFINEKEGWAVGSEGMVLYTTDGGTQWEKKDIGTTRSIGCVYFINSQSGWLFAGDELYRTTDGGKTWEKSSLSIKMPRSGTAGSSTIINMVGETVPDDWWKGDIFFADEKNGWAVLGLWYIFHTEDGGTTWVNQLSTGYMSYGLFRIVFSDNKKGCAVGTSILCTEDGGNSWSERLGIKPGRREKISDYDISFIDASLVNQSVMWAAGEEGQIMKTSDSGKTWTMVSRNDQCGINAFFVNKKTGWRHSYNSSYLCKTDDGGVTQRKQDVGMNVNGIYFIDAMTGWAVGVRRKAEGEQRPSEPFQGKVWAVIKQTTDGGRTWKPQYEERISNQFHSRDLMDIYFLDHNRGWAVGDKGIMLHTEDGGKHWVSQKSESAKYDLGGIQFVNSKVGWIAGIEQMGDGGWTGVILYTVDGGSHWKTQYKIDDVGLTGIVFIDKKNGFVTGQSEDERDDWVLHTADGGKTWTKKMFEDLGHFDPDFIDKQRGVISTEKGWIIITNDGGKTWVKKRKPLNRYPWYFSEMLEVKNR